MKVRFGARTVRQPIWKWFDEARDLAVRREARKQAPGLERLRFIELPRETQGSAVPRPVARAGIILRITGKEGRSGWLSN